jgi:hypothetical protein
MSCDAARPINGSGNIALTNNTSLWNVARTVNEIATNATYSFSRRFFDGSHWIGEIQ